VTTSLSLDMSSLREWLKEQDMSSLTEQESSRLKKSVNKEEAQDIDAWEEWHTRVAVSPQQLSLPFLTRTHAQEKYNRYPGRPNTVK
jgi:hypothetical protein